MANAPGAYAPGAPFSGAFMKNQYLCDVGDYGKYGLLRFLAGQGLRIGVNWYLTPCDGRSDGCHKEYLEDARMRVYDKELYDALQRLDARKDKCVQTLQADPVLAGLRFFDAPMDFDELPWRERKDARARWHLDALHTLDGTELVFADPDNGLSMSKPATQKGAQKFILPDEIAKYYQRGQTIVYYHHRPRKDEAGWMRDKTMIRDRLPDARLLAVSFNRWGCRSYIFVLHEEQFALYRSVVDTFLRTDWGTHTVDGKHAFKWEPI